MGGTLGDENHGHDIHKGIGRGKSDLFGADLGNKRGIHRPIQMVEALDEHPYEPIFGEMINWETGNRSRSILQNHTGDVYKDKPVQAGGNSAPE
jgi:hypothetical protein